MHQLSGYDESNTLLAEDTAQFSIDINGKIIDTVRTDKLNYTTDETILLSDDIYNNTTNTYVRNLNVKIDILDSVNNETVRTITGCVYLSGRKMISYYNAIKAADLGVGSYSAVSTVSDGEEILSSSRSEFNVLEITDLTAHYSGNIFADDYTDKHKKLRFYVTNHGTEDSSNLTLRVGVYTSNGELISAIDKPADIPAGETISFTELYNTEPLKIGSYPVVLSILSSDGSEAILDYCGFEVDSINEYTVTFVDYDGRIIDTQLVKYGESAVAPESPSRESDAKYMYTFKGWDTDFSDVTYSITVTAIYEAKLIFNEDDQSDSDILDTDFIDTEETDSDSSDTDNTDTEETDSNSSDTDNTDTEETDSNSSDTDNTDTEETDSDSSYTDNTDTDETDSDSSDTDNTDTEETDSDSSDTDNTDTEETDGDSSDTDNTDAEETDGDLPETDSDLQENNHIDDNKTVPDEKVTYDSQIEDVYYPTPAVFEVKSNTKITSLSSTVKTGDRRNKVPLLFILTSALAAILLLSVKKLSKNKIGEAE